MFQFENCTFHRSSRSGIARVVLRRRSVRLPPARDWLRRSQSATSRNTMGQPDLFAKRTFAEETERVTAGAVMWQDPPEIRLERVQADGLLAIRRPGLLAHLPPPWPAAQAYEEIVVELKLAGDHLDMSAVERALLRRQARQVQRVEERAPSWPGETPLWLAAPHVPGWLRQARHPVRFAPGCYAVEPLGRCFVWVAANELPLRDELVPFLVARSGQPLDEFARWVAPRRPLEWVLSMLQYLPMSMTAREELLWRFARTGDPEIDARQDRILEVLLTANPKMKQRLVDEGRLEGRLDEARAALRRVLAHRQIPLASEDEARIEACVDLATLERWLGQALAASSAQQALR
ncbi:hypothetical protein WME90_08605 [Sorangium sp. So ce375]|uniref:hypothetical protein n=1 Tax=Sorangium sp. So ce375 TaxID=3133306 RepID=UPI003F5C12D0